MENKQTNKTSSSAQSQAGRFSLSCRRFSLLFYPGLQLTGWGPSTWLEAICFSQSTNSNASLIKNTLTDIIIIIKNVLPSVWAPHDPVKPIHVINHHTCPGTVQFGSAAQWCPTLCNPMNRSTPGLPVHHNLPEFTQTHAHWVSGAIQPSHLL